MKTSEKFWYIIISLCLVILTAIIYKYDWFNHDIGSALFSTCIFIIDVFVVGILAVRANNRFNQWLDRND